MAMQGQPQCACCEVAAPECGPICDSGTTPSELLVTIPVPPLGFGTDTCCDAVATTYAVPWANIDPLCGWDLDIVHPCAVAMGDPSSRLVITITITGDGVFPSFYPVLTVTVTERVFGTLWSIQWEKAFTGDFYPLDCADLIGTDQALPFEASGGTGSYCLGYYDPSYTGVDPDDLLVTAVL